MCCQPRVGWSIHDQLMIVVLWYKIKRYETKWKAWVDGVNCSLHVAFLHFYSYLVTSVVRSSLHWSVDVDRSVGRDIGDIALASATSSSIVHLSRPVEIPVPLQPLQELEVVLHLALHQLFNRDCLKRDREMMMTNRWNQKASWVFLFVTCCFVISPWAFQIDQDEMQNIKKYLVNLSRCKTVLQDLVVAEVLILMLGAKLDARHGQVAF